MMDIDHSGYIVFVEGREDFLDICYQIQKILLNPSYRSWKWYGEEDDSD